MPVVIAQNHQVRGRVETVDSGAPLGNFAPPRLLYFSFTPVIRMRKLYEIYGSGVFRDFQEFDHVFSYITSTHRHTAMVILPNAPAGALGLAGCVFWYRARMDLPKSQAGHPAIWQYAKERTDETKTRDMALLSTTEFGD